MLVVDGYLIVFQSLRNLNLRDGAEKIKTCQILLHLYHLDLVEECVSVRFSVRDKSFFVIDAWLMLLVLLIDHKCRSSLLVLMRYFHIGPRIKLNALE